MTDRSDDKTLRRYREAAEVADERPSATTRAAILAAAAREVAAKPRDASKPGPVGSRRLGRAPMAAAAAVLLSTLAVMLAQRTEQEMPQLEAPASTSVAQAPAASAVPAAPPAAEEPEAKKLKQESAGESQKTRVQSFNEAPAKPAARERPTRVESEPESRLAKQSAPTEAAADSAAGARQAKEADAVSAESGRNAAPVPAAKAVSPPSVAAPAAPPPTAAPASPGSAPAPEARTLGATSGALRKDERQRAARDQAATPSAAFEAKSDADATTWLEKIIALRAKGDDVEADAELKRFRERFPEVVIPPQALARPGTR